MLTLAVYSPALIGATVVYVVSAAVFNLYSIVAVPSVFLS